MPSVGGVPKGQISGGLFWLFNALSAIMSALAIVALARHAFVTWSLTAPMALILDAYNSVMQVLFGWAHPYLQAALTWLGSWTGWRPTLYPHWRDMLVVSGLLFVARCRAYRFLWRNLDSIDDLRTIMRRPELLTHKRIKILIALSAMLTGLNALVAALVAGLLPLHSNNLADQLLIATTIGIALLVPTQSTYRLFFVIGGFAALTTWLFTRGFGHAGTGLFGAAAAILLFAIYLLFRGFLSIDYASFHGYVSDTEQFHDYNSIIAITILTGFLGAFAFFAIDAGLKLLMG